MSWEIAFLGGIALGLALSVLLDMIVYGVSKVIKDKR